MSTEDAATPASSIARPAPDDEALREEAQRLRELRVLVDLATAVITQERPSRDEAERLVAAARQRILELFPDKGDVFDLVLAPRFARLVAALPEPRSAQILPFRRA